MTGVFLHFTCVIVSNTPKEWGFDIWVYAVEKCVTFRPELFPQNYSGSE